MRLKALEEEVKGIRSDTNAALTVSTALKAGQDAANQRLDRMEAKIDALAKANGVKMAAVPNWAGDPQFQAAPSTTAPVNWSQMQVMPASYQMMGGGYSMGSMGMQPKRVGLFGRRGAGGGCANGSCGN